MIISKKVWKEHDELIKSLTKERHTLYLRIQELNIENSRLRFQLFRLQDQEIDFPATEKLHEDKLF